MAQSFASTHTKTTPPQTAIAKRKKRRFSRRRIIAPVNEHIRSSQVRVIDGESNKQLGVLNTREAIQMAKARGLDLVEVTSGVNPPVCKIVDYGKYKYEESKRKKETPKAKGGKLKEVKFRVGIEQHDYNLKLSRAEEFLGENNKLRVQLMFRGRQMAHKEIGFQLMDRVAEDLEGMGTVDLKPKLSGRFIAMQISPLPAAQQVRKFTIEEDEPQEAPASKEESDDEEE